MQALKGTFDDWKLRFMKRSKVRVQSPVGKRASTYTSESRGRPTRYRAPKEYPHSNIAFLPSVAASLARQGARIPLRLSLVDLRVWIRQGKAPLTIVLIADVSSSTIHFLEPTARIISILYRDAYRNRDKLGLVAIQDGHAQIINHPSRNLKTVLGNLTRLKPQGLTPLAEAMERALEVFRQEQRRQPAYNPLAVLLSDCHPEPVHSRTGNLMDEPEYQRAIQLAKQFRRQRVPIVVINPGHGVFEKGGLKGELWWGTKLAMRITALSGGRYYGIPIDRYQKQPGALTKYFERKYLEIDSRNLRNVLVDFRDKPVDSFLH